MSSYMHELLVGSDEWPHRVQQQAYKVYTVLEHYACDAYLALNYVFNMDLCNYNQEPYFPVHSPHTMCPQTCGCTNDNPFCPGTCPTIAVAPHLGMLNVSNSRYNASTAAEFATEIADAFLAAVRED